MTSTFFGLETAKRGMAAQQSALNTTAHNISNANTQGYSRQRVNFVQMEPFPPTSINSPAKQGQIGAGVKVETIERVRDGFLDNQYRNESTKTEYWNVKADALKRMEDILNEPSEAGLSATLDRFWQSLQDLAVNPSSTGARSVVRERGIALAETFQYLSSSIKSVQTELKKELNVTVTDVNFLSSQINHLNQKIAEIEPHGYVANDLYDERDRLLDQLSSLANIKVTYTPSGGNSNELAEGVATVEILNDKGNSIGTLIDAKQKKTNELSANYDSETGLVKSLTIGTKEIDVLDFRGLGKISGLIDSYGYMYSSEDSVIEEGIYPDLLKQLDSMAFDFAKGINNVHQEGWSVKDVQSDVHTPIDFFSFGNRQLTNSKGAAEGIQVSKEIISSADYIAAALPDSEGKVNIGDGQNAIQLAGVKHNEFTIDGKKTTISSYYEGIIGGMAILSQEADRSATNSQMMKDAINDRKQSISSVSLDEEMTNMIQFQQAYNASARMITLQDELLDRIINGMGLSGR